MTRKKDLLQLLLQSGELGQTLVFTRTKARANQLVRRLETSGRRVVAIHGNKSQNARTRALAGFRAGAIDTLIATDIAARGLDVDGISHVVNFDLPNVPEDYVHRIGRTARAGQSGDAISLAAPDERTQLAAIERFVGKPIRREQIAGFTGPLQRLACCSMQAMTASGSTGLARNGCPPIRPCPPAVSAWDTSAVKKTIGVPCRTGSALISVATAPPSASGITISRKMRSGRKSRAVATARLPTFSTRTSKAPFSSRFIFSVRETPTSSSTNRIRAFYFQTPLGRV